MPGSRFEQPSPRSAARRTEQAQRERAEERARADVLADADDADDDADEEQERDDREAAGSKSWPVKSQPRIFWAPYESLKIVPL